MQSAIQLKSNNWVAGGTLIVPLTTLPPGKRCRSLRIYFDLSGTKNAGVDSLTADNFALACQRIQIGEYVSIAGESLWELNKALFGHIPGSSGDIAAAGGTFDMEFSLVVPFRDPRQTGSDDGSMPAELLQTLSVQITMASATVHGVGTLTITAGVIYCFAEMVEESAIPQVCRLYDQQPGTLNPVIEPGVIKEMFLLDGGPGTNGTITLAEVTAVDMRADGLQVFASMRHEQIVSWYNEDCVDDAAAALSVNAASRFPMVWPDKYRKAHITKQPAIEKGGDFRVNTGNITASTMTVVTWRALPKSDAAAAAIADVVGEDRAGAAYLPSTATKSALGSTLKSNAVGRLSRKARLASSVLPGHFRQHVA